MLKITFDATGWRMAALPERFPDEADIASFRKISSAIARGEISAMLPETVFTLEAIRTSWQQRSDKWRPPVTRNGVTEQPDGTMGMSPAQRADRPAPPSGNASIATDWDVARRLGFRLLHCSRLAMTTNPDLQSEWFVGATYDIAKRFGACSREIASNGCGSRQWDPIEVKYPGLGQPWEKGVAQVPAAEAGAVARAAAEWTDADAVAAHYAYGNDYLCTRVVAASDGADAVFSARNRAWLESKYGIKFVSPQRLASMIDRE